MSVGCQSVPMDPDSAFTALSNSRRRQMILSLARADGPTSASDLAVEIAAIEEGIDPSAVTGEQRTRVYICLTQTHLPTLDQLGVVEYDSRSKQVGPTDRTEPLAGYIRRLQTACYQSGGDQ